MDTMSIRTGRPFFTAGHEFLKAIKEDRNLFKRYRSTLNELNKLTDDELADLHPVFKSPKDIAYSAVYGRRPRQKLRLIVSH